MPASRRHLAPDLARGVMLLVIALAHAHFFATVTGGADHVDSVLDRVVTAGKTMLVEQRGYPMFAALFGYGVAQIYLRRTGDGGQWSGVRSLLRRRARWLVVFGLVHVIVLFPGDILAVYGVLSLVLVGAVRFRARTLVIMAVAWVPVGMLLHALVVADGAGSGSDGLPPIPRSEGFVAEILWRVGMFGILGVLMLLCTVVPFLVGILAARHRVLEEPERHLLLLRWVAAGGFLLGVLGGLPLALIQGGVWTEPSPLGAFVAGGLHQVTGYAGGLGYAALIALAAHHLTGWEGPVTNALAALGQRSMTFYLAQSVAWAVLFASYTLNWQMTSPATAVVVGVAVWLVTLLGADQMARRDIRGPAETALRRLTYAR
nr:DUF418 domain-containing protein [Spiractinospora alimapuensis]